MPNTIFIEGNDELGYVAKVPDLDLSTVAPTVDDAEREILRVLRARKVKPGMVQVEVTA